MAITYHFENLTEEEIDLKLKGGASVIALLEEGNFIDTEQVKGLFEYVNLLIFNHDIVGAYQVLEALEEPIDRLIEETNNSDEAVDLMIDWINLTIRMIPHNDDEFLDYSYYQAGLDIYYTNPQKYALHTLKSQLSILVSYWVWLANGGRKEAVDKSVRKELKQLDKDIESRVEAQITTWKEAERYDEIADLYRDFGRFLLRKGNIEEGIDVLKELRAVLPQTTNYIRAYVGDAELEIGSIYYELQQYDQAKTHFESAASIYSTAGESYLIFYEQAQSWLELCAEMLENA